MICYYILQLFCLHTFGKVGMYYSNPKTSLFLFLSNRILKRMLGFLTISK